MTRTIPLLLAGSTLLATPLAAQEAEGEKVRRVIVGAGVQLRPSYPGADEAVLGPLPVVRVRKRGDRLPARAPDQNSSIRLLGPRDGLNGGITLNFQGRRRESDVGAAVGNVGFTVEAGVFLSDFVTDDIRLRAEVRHGLGGHDAFVGELAADYVLRPKGDRTVATVGPRIKLADARYQRAYFGVTPDIAAATGLPAYEADAGVTALGVSAGVLTQFSPRWGAYSYAGYDRLVADAAESPIVRRFGSRDQFSVGAALTYSFNLKL